MKIATQKYARKPISDLTPHPRNPRQGDIGAIHQSIEANGFYGAIIVQKSTGYVLAGNHRLQAAAHANATHVPVIEVDCDDQTALRILLADNRSNDLATYDDESLVAVLTDLIASPEGLTGTGFDGDDLDALVRSLESPDLDALAGEVGEHTDADGNPVIRVAVPPVVMAAWKAHVDTHTGDEAGAMAALLGVEV